MARRKCKWGAFVQRYGVPVELLPWECRVGGKHRRAFLKGIRTNRLWSVVEGDDGSWWMVTGNHIVNREMYFVTPRPHDGKHEEHFVDGIGEEAVRA